MGDYVHHLDVARYSDRDYVLDRCSASQTG